MYKSSLTFVLAAILALARVGGSVTCYECVHMEGFDEDPLCADPFNTEAGVPTVTDCQYGCEKTEIQYSGYSNWHRGCYYQELSQCPNECVNNRGIITCTYCCSGDLCNDQHGNGVSTFRFSFLAMMCGSLLAVFTSRVW